jgi:dipeptidyl aminopeptidase/acylaminoacyl peptidase
MERDLRGSVLYREAESLAALVWQPGSGQIRDAAELHAAPDGARAVFTGSFFDRLEGQPTARICEVDLESGELRVVTFGPGTDRLPKYSPDGCLVAFLSDRLQAGDFQLHLLDVTSGAVRATALVDGWVEYLQWSPDGTRVLLGVAGYGADRSGAQGAIVSEQVACELPTWAPKIETGEESYRWRSVWVYELTSDRARRVSPASSNIWEAVWCGNRTVAAVVSKGPGEGLWYGARLALIEETGKVRELYVPKDQLGWPAGSASGEHVAVVEAVCSDRGLVAGELRLINVRSGQVRTLNTHGVDISFAEWRSNARLLLAGHRGFETVVGHYDLASASFTMAWSSSELTTGGTYASVAGFNDAADCVLVGESFLRPPEIAVIKEGRYQPRKSFDTAYGDQVESLAEIERLQWNAKDGLDLQGWLLRPRRPGPHPLILSAHGGPVWHWRPRWLGRTSLHSLLLLARGFAIFLPNPRGSGGRGQAFARHVVGDMGGMDTYDFLSGLDYLIERGIADPRRIGVTGVSYGGFMSSWLITQDSRFAAAVPVAPVNNYVTEHLLSNIPHWVSSFLEDSYTNPGGKYFQRSPIMHAHKARTPTLNICGALDRSAPPEEAQQFHSALLENGVKSVLVTYPEEGHGVRKFPAIIDYAARIVSWFEEHV